MLKSPTKFVMILCTSKTAPPLGGPAEQRREYPAECALQLRPRNRKYISLKLPSKQH